MLITSGMPRCSATWAMAVVWPESKAPTRSCAPSEIRRSARERATSTFDSVSPFMTSSSGRPSSRSTPAATCTPRWQSCPMPACTPERGSSTPTRNFCAWARTMEKGEAAASAPAAASAWLNWRRFMTPPYLSSARYITTGRALDSTVNASVVSTLTLVRKSAPRRSPVRISRWLAPLVVALVPAAVLAAEIQGIDLLSNRADLISGGDALVAARLAPGTDAAAVRVTLNGSDITSSFAVRENGQYQGLVTGLAEGDNLLRARMPDGAGHEVIIKNHPIGGPVFSGEQIQPWLCRTQLQGGTTPALGASVDEKCNAAAPIVELFYRSTGNQWVAYTPTTLPELIQPTTTDEGKTVPFIIQRVTGTANRGIYQIAVLVDPSKPIEPWSTGQPWNRKYVNTFGGACSVNYQQPTVGDVRNVARLALGFAVGTSGLNTYGNSCSDVISAEALMMTKEIVTERWGPILYTLGDGGSA